MAKNGAWSRLRFPRQYVDFEHRKAHSSVRMPVQLHLYSIESYQIGVHLWIRSTSCREVLVPVLKAPTEHRCQEGSRSDRCYMVPPVQMVIIKRSFYYLAGMVENLKHAAQILQLFALGYILVSSSSLRSAELKHPLQCTCKWVPSNIISIRGMSAPWIP